MKTIVLPGYSPHNRDWAYEVKNKIKIPGEIIVHEWEHWDSSIRKSFSLKAEIENVSRLAFGEKVNIIAKSVGTRVVMHLLVDGLIKINKLVLCGIPTKGDEELILGKVTVDASENIYAMGLREFPTDKVIIFQNDHDPFARYEDIKRFIWKINSKIKIVEKEGSTHNYPYFEDFADFLSS